MDIKRQMRLHYAVSALGGFLAGYTVFNHSDILGNAQTGNLIRMVFSACRGDIEAVLFALLCFLCYAAGNVFYVLARRKVKISMKIVSLILCAAVIAATGILGFTNIDYIIILPVAFYAPVQWNAYKIAGENSSSTIFSSNNVRQAVISLTNYIIDRDKAQLYKAKFYWLTLLFFHIGVAFVCLLSIFIDSGSIWFAYVFLAAAGVEYYRYKTVTNANP